MQGFKHDQRLMRNDIRMLNDTFQKYVLQQTATNPGINVHWTEEHNIHWPLKTKEDYDNLNNVLQNETIRNEFVCRVQC